MGFWITLIVNLILMALAYLLRPKPELPEDVKPNLKGFTFPTIDAGRPVSEVFGTVKLEGNIIWQGDITTTEITEEYEVSSGLFGTRTEEVIIGYAWFVSFAIALCSSIDAFLEFRFKDTISWSGEYTTSGNNINVKTGETSDTEGSGNSNSDIVIYLGDQTSADSFLSSQTGYNITYRDISYLVFNNAFVGDNARNVPSYSYVVKKTNLVQDGLGGYTWSTYKDINYDATTKYADANPSLVLVYILNSLLELDNSLINYGSFYSAAQTLYNENLGISFVIDNARDTSEWIKDILKTIDGVLYFNISDSKFYLKLIRDDYDPGTIDIITDSNAKIQIERRAWEDCSSDIAVSFTDRNSNFKNTTYISINSAVREILGYRKVDSYSFMSISNSTAIQPIIKRLIKKASYPYIIAKFTVSRQDFPTLYIGDVVKINSTIAGMSGLIVRIVNMVSYKTYDQKIEFEAVEDIFSIGSMNIDVIDTAQNQPYDWSVGNIVTAHLFDAPAEWSIEASVVAVFKKPTGFIMGVNILENSSKKVTYNGGAYGYGKLSTTYNWTGYSQSENEIDDTSGGFQIDTTNNINAISASRQDFQKLLYLAWVGDTTNGYELIAFQNLIDLGGGSYKIENIMRGLCNTIVRTHNINEEFWYMTVPVQQLRPVLLNTYPNISLNFQPFNHIKYGNITNITHTYGYTRETPYPIFNLKASRNVNDITLNWQPAVRQKGAIYVDADTIVAGTDEGTTEGEWHISWDNWTSYVVSTNTTYTRTDPSSQTYRIKSYKDGLYSSEKTIVI